MSILIKKARIIDSTSSNNGEVMDIYISKGRISKIAPQIDEDASEIIEGNDLCVSAGWVDIMADYCEPGYEYKETLESGANAAKAGGYTDVFVVPNTQPAITNKSMVAFIENKTKSLATQIHVLGAISKELEGTELAEMMDMRHEGAVAFSDGWLPVQNAGLMVKALEYVKAFDGVIIQIPEMTSLAADGLMHEGELSLQLGMSGIPEMAEYLMVQRDIELVRYTQSKIHFSGVTSSKSLALIKEAKKEGLNVTCSVTPFHLLFTDEKLKNYQSLFKVTPPLRTEEDRLLLIQALEEGIIDCIASHHRPQDWDAKTKEFEYAEYGMASQEIAWTMLLEAAPSISSEKWVDLLSTNARKIFGLTLPKIEEGSISTLTVFDRTTKWNYNKQQKQSIAYNSPLLQQDRLGKARAIISTNI